MPNFAFHHSIRGVRQSDTEGLDLSSWRRLYNASEPVRFQSLRMFLERFAPLGFREEALGSGYGLAEITGAVTLSPLGRPPRVDWVRLREYQEERLAMPAEPESPGSIPLVSSGELVSGAEVQIVDESDKPLPDRHIGQIHVRSNASLSGYFRRPDLTSVALRLGWHPTGDLGYWVDGELFVTGRSKDLIISGGKNIYPEDIESMVDTIPGLRPGRSVAFGRVDPAMGTEGIILVSELAQPVDPEEGRRIAQAIRRRIAQTLDVTLMDLRLVERGWVLKTPAGKMARSANREKYQALLLEASGGA
jgi:acyl-CoA synthetase (AMP-forming)/AMP-acid ligase II